MNTKTKLHSRIKLVTRDTEVVVVKKACRTHPADCNKQVKLEAYEMYMEGFFPAQIAEVLVIPVVRVFNWSRGGWCKERRNMMAAGKAVIQKTAQQHVTENLPAVMGRQLRLADKMDQTVERSLDGMPRRPDPFQVNQLAQAMSKSADIAARVVGLGQENGLNIKIGVAVHVGAAPLSTPRPVQQADVIDVTPHLPAETGRNPLPE